MRCDSSRIISIILMAVKCNNSTARGPNIVAVEMVLGNNNAANEMWHHTNSFGTSTVNSAQ